MPVAWVVTKTGCVHAFRFTHEDHRWKGLSNVISTIHFNEGLSRGEEFFVEVEDTNMLPRTILPKTSCIGQAKAIITGTY